MCSGTAHGQQRFVPERPFSVEERETIRQTLEFSSTGGQKMLEVEGVLGAIHVTGYDGTAVEMTANKTVRANTPEQARLARDTVRLDVSDKADTIRIDVDQPNQMRDPGYQVIFDFELRVPRATNIRLQNVRDEIRVQDMTGDFDLSSVSGRIDMTMVAGSGRVHAVSGPVEVNFSRNPTKDSYFGSLSGEVDVTFQKDLSADLKFKTFNAGVYTDFPVTALPVPVNAPERRNGMFIYKSEYQGARVGKGGPMLEFDGFNRDIRIRQAK